MIKALIIDADGVAIKRDKRFSDRLQTDYGISAKTTAPFFETVFQKCVVGKADLKEELARHYKDWGYKGTLEELLDYWFSKEGTYNDEMLFTIKKLRSQGIKVFLATDNEKYRTDYIVNEFGFGKLFDGVFSSAYVGCRKESEDFWREVESKLNIKTSGVLVWDDERENLDATKRTGFITELFVGMDDFNEKMKRYFEFPCKPGALTAGR